MKAGSELDWDDHFRSERCRTLQGAGRQREGGRRAGGQESLPPRSAASFSHSGINRDKRKQLLWICRLVVFFGLFFPTRAAMQSSLIVPQPDLSNQFSFSAAWQSTAC